MKTLRDLPQFTILSIQEPETPVGDTRLVGKFDHVVGVKEGRSWLYVSREESLIGDLAALDLENRTATFFAPWPNRRVQVGATFPHVDGYWDAADIAIVLDSAERWKRLAFVPPDAAMFREPGWKQLVPVSDAARIEGQPDGVIPGGWDHEHCKLCRQRIEAEGYGYTDSENRWLCSICYETYVVPHDLSFLGR